MSDFTFKPAGVAFAAIVAGLGGGVEPAVAPAPMPAGHDEAEDAAVDYADLPAAEPLGAGNVFELLDRANKDVPLARAVQLRLPLGD